MWILIALMVGFGFGYLLGGWRLAMHQAKMMHRMNPEEQQTIRTLAKTYDL